MACRLLLVDDHPALTQGLAALLAQEPDLVVSGQVASGDALLEFLATAPVPAADLVLLDLYLPPPLDGLTLLPRLRREWPGLRVLVFSSAASPMLVSQVAAAGAHGFLDKSAEAVALLAAIRAVHTGQLVFPARLRAPSLPGAAAWAQVCGTTTPGTVAADALLRLRLLSARERGIIGLIRAGLSTRAIAKQLGLTELTVSTHRRNLLHKLGLHGVAELVRFAHEHGL
jgi:DNA-binding NarL/FixJ family response regulator